MEIFNSLYQILEKEDKEEFKILFEDKTSWYDINQSGKQNWDKSKDKIAQFDKALKDFIEFQIDDDMYNLSYIVFPHINFKAYFENNTITKYISFEDAIFQGVTFFTDISFASNANFRHTTFSNIIMFSNSIFQKNADFYNATFKSNAIFIGVTFEGDAYFPLSKFEGDAIFASAKFNKNFNCLNTSIEKFFLMENANISNINFNGLTHKNANYLNIAGLNNNNQIEPLNKNNFINKESARIIKASFEKQGNIIEANKYFIIEQEKYIEQLRNKDNKTETNKLIKLIPLCLNKLISNFGTDWVRSILVLFLWGFVVLFLYMTNRYSLLTFPNEFYMAGEWNKSNSTTTISFFVIFILIYLLNLYFVEVQNYKRKAIIGYFGFLHKHIKIKSKLYKTLMNIKFLLLGIIAVYIFIFYLYDSNLFNLISKLINPINAFKDDDTFKGYEAFGALVRIISATIIYQIIVAFRQFTRRS